MVQSKTAWSVRRPMILGLCTILVLGGGFGTWAALSQIAGAVVAAGWIEVDQNRQVIQHPEGGTVQELLIAEGESVAAGQVLLRIDGSDAASNLAVVTAQLNETRARRARLEAERDTQDMIRFPDDLLEQAWEDHELADIIVGQENLFFARRETFERELDQLMRRAEQIESQINGLEAQQVAVTQQQQLVAEDLTTQQNLLERGLAQSARVLTLRREEANLLGTSGELEASIAGARGRITEIELAALQRRNERRETAIAELREIRVQEEELTEHARSLARAVDRSDLRAPVSGIIYDLAIFGAGSVIRAAEPILYIVPQDRPLVISARIEAIHVDQVAPTQAVTLRFPSFDARMTPELEGYVTRVSADTFIDEATGTAFYEVEIMLADGEIRQLGDVTLLPGMPVEAFIRTQDRTPLAYLVQPLSDYFSRAFREG